MKTTTIYKGVALEVYYYWEAEEPMVMYYGDGSGYPGSAEIFEIIDILHKGESIYCLLEDKLEEIELLITQQDKDGC